MMRLNKILVALVAITAFTSSVWAQDPPAVELYIRLRDLGTTYSETDVSTLTPVPFGTAGTTQEISVEPNSYVQVTTWLRYVNHDPSTVLGVSIVNSFISFAGSGITIYEGFTTDERGYDSDARKNVHSHEAGNSNADQASNSLAEGQPAAIGRSVYSTPRTTSTPGAMYSFVIRMPNTPPPSSLQVAFSGVRGGGNFRTDALGNTPQGRPYSFAIRTFNAQINLVPEPASMIALGTGLAGLLAVRRRRK